MKEKIIEFAKLNTEIASANVSDLHVIKLNSIEDLDNVKDLMTEDAIESLDDVENREYIAEDIESGITFIFWYDEENKLEYSR
jgi:hypothetical protein